eukprot:5432187-Alexandrium_andersonii.AAC.1
MGIQQGVTIDGIDIDKELRKDPVRYNNERTRNQQWFSSGSAGTHQGRSRNSRGAGWGHKRYTVTNE